MLHVLAQALQEAEGLVEDHRHRNLREFLRGDMRDMRENHRFRRGHIESDQSTMMVIASLAGVINISILAGSSSVGRLTLSAPHTQNTCLTLTLK